MPGTPIYLDSSALVKLVLPEAESVALVKLLREEVRPISSELATVEVIRAARRASPDPEVHRRAAAVMAGVHLIRIDSAILERAAIVEPESLRALDAMHLASALSLAPDIEAMVAYDTGLGEAAAAAGLRVISPS